MYKKLCLLLLPVFMAWALALPAAAWEDAGKEPAVEDNETSISGSISMSVGKQKELSGFIDHGTKNEDAPDPWYFIGALRWASSNPDVVSVDAQGVASALRVGTARITATGWDNTGRRHVQTVVVGVTVGSAASDTAAGAFEALEGSRINLRELAEIHCKTAEITWTSGVPEIASVDANGLVLARSAGRCTISASCVDENGDTRTVKYRVRVLSIALSDRICESSATLPAGAVLDVGTLLYPNDQELPGGLRSYSAVASNTGAAAVDGLLCTAGSTGKSTLSLYRGEAGEKLLHRLKITVQ